METYNFGDVVYHVEYGRALLISDHGDMVRIVPAGSPDESQEIIECFRKDISLRSSHYPRIDSVERDD